MLPAKSIAFSFTVQSELTSPEFSCISLSPSVAYFQCHLKNCCLQIFFDQDHVVVCKQMSVRKATYCHFGHLEQ